MNLKTRNGYEFEIDDEDFSKISNYGWYGETQKTKLINGEFGRPRRYIKAHINKKDKRTNVCLHHVICNPPEKMQIDHMDGNGLNNKKDNLRICTCSENNANKQKFITNTSGYKGVCWHKRFKKWIAQIEVNSKRHHIGYFNSKEHAAIAYNQAAVEYFGEFARLNEVR